MNPELYETPPYQWIDIVLGAHLVKEPPVRGYYVTVADTNLKGGFAICPIEAETMRRELCKKSKYGVVGATTHRAWHHIADDGRKYWTPR